MVKIIIKNFAEKILNAELIEALEESNIILNEIEKGKRTGFNSIEQLINSLDN